mmetsp:Transcript_22993/g.50418  ORF Transcript_22993/g.50418 Transcript_22993/m.50418 type:complete len:200 (+) Transcript_22993:335-934(+)
MATVVAACLLQKLTRREGEGRWTSGRRLRGRNGGGRRAPGTCPAPAPAPGTRPNAVTNSSGGVPVGGGPQGKKGVPPPLGAAWRGVEGSIRVEGSSGPPSRACPPRRPPSSPQRSRSRSCGCAPPPAPGSRRSCRLPPRQSCSPRSQYQSPAGPAASQPQSPSSPCPPGRADRTLCPDSAPCSSWPDTRCRALHRRSNL